MRNFCANILAPKLQSQNITREKLRKALLHEKRVSKLLMKLTSAYAFHQLLSAKSYNLSLPTFFIHFPKLLIFSHN
jgi:hypothetical protein